MAFLFGVFMATYVKLTGTAMALDTYSGEGSLAGLTDNNKATFWHSNGANESTWNSFCGITFAAAQAVRKIEIDFARWGSKIVIGYAAAKPATSGGFTVLRTIDTNVTPTDDLGVAWGSDRSGLRTNTIILDTPPSAKCWGIINLDNAGNPLSDGVSTNTRLTVYEIAMFSDTEYVVPPPPAISSSVITGTAFCDKNAWYQLSNPIFGPDKLNDGGPTTRWIGTDVSATLSLQNFCGIKFATPQDVSGATVSFASWGKSFRIGTWANGVDPAGASFTKADIIPLRSFDTAADVDADSKVIVLNTNLRFSANASQIPGLVFYCDDNANNPLTNSAGQLNTSLSLNEIVVHGAVLTVDRGINPKPPATIPALPFLTTPAGWVRTEFATPGDFSFTPSAGTTLMLAVAVGAGSGGRVIYDLTGNRTPNDSTLFGGDTSIKAGGVPFHTAPGGEAEQRVPAILPMALAQENWLRYADNNGNVGNVNTTTLNAAAGAVATVTGSVAGTGYTQVANNTNDGLAATNFFSGVAALPGNINPTYDGFARNSTNGFESTNATVGSTGTVSFQMKCLAGQQYNFTVGFTLGTGGQAYNKLSLEIDGVETNTRTSDGNSTYNFTGTFTTDGVKTFVFKYLRNSAPATPTNGYIKSFTLTNVNIPGAISGASGNTSHVFFAPKPITFTVGAGGIGVPGGQTVTAAQKGTRGGGGAAGANGGDGVVIIYEYKGDLLFEEPVIPIFNSYNNLTVNPTGSYRTNYIGIGTNATQNYVHRVRPRTKRVIVVMVGAGGGSVSAQSPPSTTMTNQPTIVSAGSKTFTCGSGSSSYRYFYSAGQYPCTGGAPGLFSGNAETLLQQDGTGNRNQPIPNIPGVINQYGSSLYVVDGAGDGINTSVYAGGSGALAMLVLSGDDLTAGTINIQVAGRGDAPNNGSTGEPGAVFIFETETEFGTATTQNSELVLVRSPTPATQVTQTAELVLQKSAPTSIQTTQTAELILVKDNTEVDMQVASVYATVVTDAPPTGMNITQTSELILQKNLVGGTAITQTAEMVLQKTLTSQYRLTQVSELFLVAETPTVFWLNFGTLDNPVRFQLYDSAIGRASSVPPNCKIQIEGFYAEGTYLVINDVPSGLIADVTNNDRVYIHGGVINYWQTSMPVYAYYEQNGETARMLVGNWNINQPHLTPLHTQMYHGSKVNQSWLFTQSAYGYAALQSIFTKALTALANLTVTTAQNLFGSLASLVPDTSKASSFIAGVVTGWDVTKTLDKISNVVDWGTTLAHSDLVAANTISWGKTSALVSDFKQKDFIDVKAAYGKNGVSYDNQGANGLAYFVTGGPAIQLSVNYSHFVLDSEQTKAGYGDYIAEEFVGQKAGYADVDQEFEYVSNIHQVHYTVVYIAVPSSSVARLFEMEPMGTIAYSVLGDMVWERSTSKGTGHWLIPTDRALFTQTYYGIFGFGQAIPNSDHSEYSQRETLVINGPQQGYFSTSGIWMQSYSAYSPAMQPVKRSEKTAPFNVTPIKTTALNGVYNLKPFLDMQSVNSIGPASLYKGFDTKADVDAFTENFTGVHTALKYNGYVYTLDVDKSFVCEIFNNGPIKWLLQGG